MSRPMSRLQQKAMFSKLNNRGGSPSKRRFTQLKSLSEDSDGDGVMDGKDCEPFNPKKQGKLHDLQIALLKRKEEKLEAKREKELKKLEDLKDVLKQKQATASKKQDIKSFKLKQKQAVIDEINNEKKNYQDLKNANKEAKAQLDKLTIKGKIKRGVVSGSKKTFSTSKKVLQGTNAFLHKKSTKRTLKKIGRFFS